MRCDAMQRMKNEIESRCRQRNVTVGDGTEAIVAVVIIQCKASVVIGYPLSATVDGALAL